MKNEVRFPIEIIDIVVVKMNSAVLRRGVAPAHLRPVPIPARHGSGRVIDQRSVERMGADVVNLRGAHPNTEIPTRKQVLCRITDFVKK